MVYGCYEMLSVSLANVSQVMMKKGKLIVLTLNYIYIDGHISRSLARSTSRNERQKFNTKNALRQCGAGLYHRPLFYTYINITGSDI